MNHIGLYYFTVAAEELNITRAAAKLFISQQTLSEHIRKLERQYDAVFFTRGGRLSLTSQGERMLRYAREVLEADRNLTAALRDSDRASRVRLRLGMTSNRGSVFLPAIVSEFQTLCPHVILSIVTGNYEYIEQEFRLERLELYAGMTSNIRTHTPTDILYYDKIYFVASRTLLTAVLNASAPEFISSHCQGVTVADTCAFPIALPPPTSTLRLVFERSFTRSGLHPEAVLETADHDILFDLCQRGICGCFLSRELLYRKLTCCPTSDILLFPMIGMDELSGFCLVYRRENIKAETATLIDCCRSVITTTLKTIDTNLHRICYEQDGKTEKEREKA